METIRRTQRGHVSRRPTPVLGSFGAGAETWAAFRSVWPGCQLPTLARQSSSTAADVAESTGR